MLSSECHPVKAASHCCSGRGCVSTRRRGCARCRVHAHLHANMAFVRSFTKPRASPCSLRLGPPGGRAGSREVTSCHGAFSTFVQAGRVTLTSRPLPENFCWPVKWALGTEGQKCLSFQWFNWVRPHSCSRLQRLSFLLSFQ